MQKGRNVIAIRGINKGGAAGILAMLQVNGYVLLTTDESWKVLVKTIPPLLWNTITFDDSSWKNVTVIASYGSGCWGSSLADWPGAGDDEEYFAHMPIVPKKVSIISGGKQISGAESLLGSKGGLAIISPGFSPADTQHILMFDFGQEFAGRVQVWGTKDANLIVTTGESLQECTHQEPTLDNHGPFTITLAGTRPASTPYTAFRYARIEYSGTKPLHLTQVRCDFKYYPVKYKGSFNCSDSLLTRIWYTGAYTAHLCMQEDIWDAPKRDRGLWIGDLQVTGQTINVAFGDKFLMERSIERVRDQAQGGRPDNELPVSEVNSIPGYSAAWFCTLADYYLHRGDKAFLKRQHTKIISLLEYLKTDFDKDNLFNNPHKVWDFCDWSPGFITDSPLARATTDLYIILGVKKAIYLLDQLGDTANADRYEKWESQLVQAARANLYNVKTDSFSDRLQENVMAILSGVATPQKDSIIYQSIIKPGGLAWTVPHGKGLSDSEVMSPYYGYFVLSVMGKLGENQDALNLLRKYWGNMLSRGATTWWEVFDPSWPRDFNWVIDRMNYISLSHGWSSGPTSFLTEHILGVRPTAPGYSDIIIQPNLCNLKWVEGNVPTPRGIIYVKVFRQKSHLIVKVKLPAGIKAHVEVPGESRGVDRQGEYIITSK
ncbi:MAG: family 78 glycoside hydrolase catalytic domain [Ignavibacteriaceae bacterium]